MEAWVEELLELAQVQRVVEVAHLLLVRQASQTLAEETVAMDLPVRFRETAWTTRAVVVADTALQLDRPSIPAAQVARVAEVVAQAMISHPLQAR